MLQKILDILNINNESRGFNNLNSKNILMSNHVLNKPHQYFQDMKNKIVDSHCHLNFDDFKDDLDNVIKNAKDKDVDYMLSISIDLEKFEEIYNLTQKYKNVWCTTGVHPNNVPKKSDIKNITKLKSHLLKNLLKKKVVGIGETGLDYYRGLENKQNQIDFLKHTCKSLENQILQL